MRHGKLGQGMDEPAWLRMAREAQAIAQAGLTYSRDDYDLDRYRRLRALAAEMMASGSLTDLRHVEDLFDGETGYATPKIAVRGAAFRDGKILMVREKTDGMWAPPGGWADVNQSAAECLVREVKEESGFDVRISKLAALFDRQKYVGGPAAFHVYVLFFICEVTGGSAQTSMETSAVDFFEEGSLPDLSIPRVLPEWIALAFAHHRDPGLATVFD